MAYATPAELESWMRATPAADLPTGDHTTRDAQFALALNAAKTVIDKHVGYSFDAPVDVTAPFEVSVTTNRLLLGVPMVSVTSVTYRGETLTADKLMLRLSITPLWQGPWFGVRRTDGGLWRPSDEPGSAVVSAGWSSVPDAAQQASLIVAAWVLHSAKAPGGFVLSEVESTPLRRVSPVAADLLDALTVGPVR